MIRSNCGCETETEGRRPILLIDDDVELCLVMTEYFEERGYALTQIHEGDAGLSRALMNEHELVILDVMLPVLDGFEVLRQLRLRSDVPAILLTERTAENERISGLNAGADDCLPKPFAPDELLARMHAVLRRTERGPQTQKSILESHNIRIDLKTREVGEPASRCSLRRLSSKFWCSCCALPDASFHEMRSARRCISASARPTSARSMCTSVICERRSIVPKGL